MKSWTILTLASFAGLHLHAQSVTLHPGDYPSGTVLTTILPAFTLHDADTSNTIETLFTVVAKTPTTGPLPGVPIISHGNDFWTNGFRLRIDFDEPTTAIQIDLIGGNNLSTASGSLVVYDSAGDQLAQYLSGNLTIGETETMALSGFSPTTAAYAIATGDDGGFARLSNLEVQVLPEPTAGALIVCGAALCLRRRRP